jgi:hypothetical protein
MMATIVDTGMFTPDVQHVPLPRPTAPAFLTNPPSINYTGQRAVDSVPFLLSVADFPKPVLNKYGRPINWNDSDGSGNGVTTAKTIGRFRIIIGGKDVTFFRNSQTVLHGWTDNEPFGDASAEISFPQVSTFETPGTRDLTWFREWEEVSIQLVLNAGVTVRSEGKNWTGPTIVPLFEGIVPAFEDALSKTDNVLTLTAMGVLYQLDLYTMPPDISPRAASDIGPRIADAINSRAVGHGFRGNACARHTTNVLSGQGGAWDKLLTGYIQDLLSVCQDHLGRRATLSLVRPKTPWIKWKDTATVHWTIWAGQPGVTYGLTSDWSSAFNVYYGEGTDDRGRHWRNTKYPNLHPDTAPLYPGSPSSLFYPGGSKTGFLPFARRMYEHGYIHMHRTNTYNSADSDEVRAVQRHKGILVDGIVGPQTWAAVFEVGSNEGDLNGSYFMPIAEWTAVEPWRFNAQGAKVGKNTHFQPSAVRIEHYDNYGDHFTKADARASALNSLHWSYHHPGWSGTITLDADLIQGSRFLIRAGENILIKGFKGRGWTSSDKVYLFHIAQVDRDLTAEPPTVTLTVDTNARDLMTIAAVAERDYNTRHPSDRQTPNHRASRITQDTAVVWDYENGAGVIPKHAQYAGLWTVMRIPAGERGTIAATRFYTSVPHSAFAVAVFGKPVTDRWLRSLLGNPLVNFKGKDGRDYNPWDYHAVALDNAGYLYAVGGPDIPAGYYPTNDTSNAKNLTGWLKDDNSWYFESQHAPWLWVAVYTAKSCYVEGRLYPGAST